MWVMAYVNEGDISKVKLGYDAEISTLSFPDETYKGKIQLLLSFLTRVKTGWLFIETVAILKLVKWKLLKRLTT